MSKINPVRLIAFYLPQYHPIPENDEWWGKGFTEWTNVAKAKPLFKGHYQPHLPADLGFYDLRVPEVREQQAELAREAGIEGFCYWHYWFAGKQLLERPINEVLASGKPDFPFCIAWGNETWTGIWHGAPNRILIEQTYPGGEDYKKHFYSLLKAFVDNRYMTIDQKPLFLIYKPKLIPDIRSFTDLWRELAAKEGLAGLYFVGIGQGCDWETEKLGLDAMTLTAYDKFKDNQKQNVISDFVVNMVGKRNIRKLYRKVLRRPFDIYDFKNAKQVLNDTNVNFEYFPCIVPNWDNTPRSNLNGFVLRDSTPEYFASVLEQAITKVSDYESDHQLVFIKSWNEWAEGNHLEPDMKFGKAYLEVIRKVMMK